VRSAILSTTALRKYSVNHDVTREIPGFLGQTARYINRLDQNFRRRGTTESAQQINGNRTALRDEKTTRQVSANRREMPALRRSDPAICAGGE
jgi:hypothetical protein